jgi:hypothetical protein
MSVTFPTPEWKRTLQDKADEWGLRPSDLLTYCLSYTLAAVESGQLEPPQGKRGRFYHRAAEFLDLPWEPAPEV